MARSVDVWGPRRRVVLASFAAPPLAGLALWLLDAADVPAGGGILAVAILMLGGGVAGTGAPPGQRLRAIPRLLLGLLAGCVVVSLALVPTLAGPQRELGSLLVSVVFGPLVLAFLIAAPVLGGFLLLPALAETVGVGTWWGYAEVDGEAIAPNRLGAPAPAEAGQPAVSMAIRASVAGAESTRYATVNLFLICALGGLVAGAVALAAGGSSTALLTGLGILVAWAALTGALAARRAPPRAARNVVVCLVVLGVVMPVMAALRMAALRSALPVEWMAALYVVPATAGLALGVGFVGGRALRRDAPGDEDALLAPDSGRARRLSAELAAATERGTADLVLRVYPGNGDSKGQARDLRALGPLGYRVARQLSLPGVRYKIPAYRLTLFVRPGVDASALPADDMLVSEAELAILEAEAAATDDTIV